MPSLNPNLEGRAYWRSLAELAGELSADGAGAGDEFTPGQAPTQVGATRREFLSLMAASMALAGLTLTGCRRWPEQELKPFASRPEGMTPGEARWYATMLERDGTALGVLARSYDGRPIKIEGNPDHPDSLGAADAAAQAAVLDLYDPDRARAVLVRSPNRADPLITSWSRFDAHLAERLQRLEATGGAGLVVLSEVTSSPTVARLRDRLLERFPAAAWRIFSPMHRDHEIEGARLAYGRPLRTHLELSQAQRILCVDADLLGAHPSKQRLARGWAAGRASADEGRMNRMYVIESAMTLTGSVADHRLPLAPARAARALWAIAAGVGMPVEAPADLTDAERTWLQSAAHDLMDHRGQAVVAVGPAQPPAVHALAHAINQRLGAIDAAVRLTEEPDARLAADELRDVQQRVDAGEVDTLLILGGNPTYDGGLRFTVNPQGPASGEVASAIHLSDAYNETSAACVWHLPRAHALECWGDGRAWDGTVTLQQPLIRPLHGGRSTIELLARMAGDGDAEPDGREEVRRTLRPILGEAGFDHAWDEALRSGVAARSAWPGVRPGVVRPPSLASLESTSPADSGAGLEAVFVTDASVHDGRGANNGWLQEMPDPVTQLVWDNAALIAVAEAQRLGLSNGDMVEVTVGERSVSLPVLIQPGVAKGAVVLPVGYGRQVVGRIGRGVGHDVFPLRSGQHEYVSRLDTFRPLGTRHVLVMTQDHHLIDQVGFRARAARVGEPNQSGLLIHESTFDAYRNDPDIFHKHEHGIALKLFDPPHAFNEPHAWGMAIDLNKCIGCNACLVGCQAENNVPMVGKQEVARHREMHWLRLDRYYKGDPDNPQVVHQPMTCAHCETAPCEQVCPVAATVHDSEGLNTMIYNRCIGTRYCSNNCPYKVRRFNYFDWHSRSPRTQGDTPPWLGIPDQQQAHQVDKLQAMVFNPDVTVRMRGVMEKCTYCTQRIQAGRIHAKLEHAAGRRETATVKDGEVQPACAGACPTDAIVFGDLNDPDSEVSRLRRNPRAWGMLDDLLDLRPRTQYLAKLRHPESDRAQESHP